MTHEEKVQYMRIAAGVCKLGFTDYHIDLLVSIYDKVLELKGGTDINSLSNIEYEAEQREKQRVIDKKKKEATI